MNKLNTLADAFGSALGLAQLDRKWSSESLRRRVRDVFFAVQRSWIERDPEIGVSNRIGASMYALENGLSQ